MATVRATLKAPEKIFYKTSKKERDLSKKIYGDILTAHKQPRIAGNRRKFNFSFENVSTWEDNQ